MLSREQCYTDSFITNTELPRQLHYLDSCII